MYVFTMLYHIRDRSSRIDEIYSNIIRMANENVHLLQLSDS